jgi:hypothetical protein
VTHSDLTVCAIHDLITRHSSSSGHINMKSFVGLQFWISFGIDCSRSNRTDAVFTALIYQKDTFLLLVEVRFLLFNVLKKY